MRIALTTAALWSVPGTPIPDPQEPVLEHISIQVGDFLFDARAAGPADGPLVLLLHGFPQTSYSFRHQILALADEGYRAVAPDQRGYSPGARPEGVESYGMASLVGDIFGIADALGADRFHLVGHDWGGAVAWMVATAYPERVLSLTSLSTPHPAALAEARLREGSEQEGKSSYFSLFARPGAEGHFLAEDAAYLRQILAGLDPEAQAEYVRVLGTPEAMRAALHWYGAAFGPGRAGASAASPPATPVTVPTLYVWSTEDVALGREAAEATHAYVSGPYRFEVLDGVDHWIAERVPERAAELLLEHIRSVEGG